MIHALTHRTPCRLLLLLPLLLVSCDTASQVCTERATMPLMSTDVTVTAVGRDQATAQSAIQATFKEMARLEGVLSRFVETSDIARCNRDAAREAVKVQPETFEVLRQSVHYAQLTGGAFDVTCMPLIAMWKQAGQEQMLPDAAAIAAARARVGSQYLILDTDAQTVRFARPGMALDLGAIAKGYIADRGIVTLRAHGVLAGIVNAGGNVSAFGTKTGAAGGPPWRVGVQDPVHLEEGAPLVDVVEVTDAGVSTSGNYRRYVEIGGKHYSHILDPRTGWTADAVPSVTVIAADGITADALSTGLSVLGVADSLKLVESLPNIEVMLITVEDGKLVKHESRGFGKFRAKP